MIKRMHLKCSLLSNEEENMHLKAMKRENIYFSKITVFSQEIQIWNIYIYKYASLYEPIWNEVFLFWIENWNQHNVIYEQLYRMLSCCPNLEVLDLTQTRVSDIGFKRWVSGAGGWC